MLGLDVIFGLISVYSRCASCVVHTQSN